MKIEINFDQPGISQFPVIHFRARNSRVLLHRQENTMRFFLFAVCLVDLAKGEEVWPLITGDKLDRIDENAHDQGTKHEDP